MDLTNSDIDAELHKNLAVSATSMTDNSQGTGGDGIKSDRGISMDSGNSPGVNANTMIASTSKISFEVTQDSAQKIAALIPDHEYEALLFNRQTLVKKLVNGQSLSKDESLRLKLIEWEIDSVDTAKAQHSMNLLFQMAKVRAEFAERITRAVSDLQALADAESAKHKFKKTA